MFDLRATDIEPSKSGVLGLLCAALGIDRSDWENLEPLTRWVMGVRVDRPGELRRDYQTAQDRPYSPKTDTTLSDRYYLADAAFLAGLESPDLEGLARAHKALLNPYWQLSLGRKSYLPSHPVYLKDGLRQAEGLEAALENWPRLCVGEPSLRMVIETASGGNYERTDQPASAFSERRFVSRRLRLTSVTPGGVACSCPD